MTAVQTLLQLANNGGLSPGMQGAVEASIVVDELTPYLPFETLSGTRAYGYDRVTGYVSASWIAPDAAMSSAGGRKIGRILAETCKLYAQPNISPEDAARSGGAASVLGDLAASCFTSMSRAIGDKAINGNAAPTATIDALSALVTTSGGITACTCGGLMDLSREQRGELKYTASGTKFRYRAPGDVDFGEEATIGTSTSGYVYSKNGHNWLYITRGAGALSSNSTVTVSFAFSADEPTGLYKLMEADTGQWIYGGADGGALTFELLDQLLDLCKGGSNRVMLMPKKIRRAMRKLLRDKATNETFADVGGRKVPTYEGIPCLVSDYMPTNRTRGSSGAVCSSIILMSLGAKEGFRGVASTGIVDPAMQGARLITSGPFGTAAYQLPVTATSDALVERAVGYFGFAQELREGIAILDGLTYSG